MTPRGGNVFRARIVWNKALYYIMDAGGLRAASKSECSRPPDRADPRQSISGYLNGGPAETEPSLLRPSALPAGHAMTSDEGEGSKPGILALAPGVCLSTTRVVHQVRDSLDKLVDETSPFDVRSPASRGGIDSSSSPRSPRETEKKLQPFSVGFYLAEFDETASRKRSQSVTEPTIIESNFRKMK